MRTTGWVNGVKSGHTNQAGYVLIGSGRKNHIQLVSAVLGTPSVAARDAATLKLLEAHFKDFQQITALRRGTVMTRVPIRYRRGAELELVAGRTIRRVVPRGQRDDVTTRVVGRPDDVAGPFVAGQSFGAIEILQDRPRGGPRAAGRRLERPEGRSGAEGQVLVHQSAAIAARRRRDWRYRPRGQADPSHRAQWAPHRRPAPRRMIITVTLNSAIDKTLSVPNFRLGRRHRTVEQTTMPGGKGVNVARVLKALGQPVIATGFTGGATGTRIVDQLTQLSVLSDFVRIREESRTNTAVIDPTNGEQTEINERGPKVSAQEVELFVDKLLYLAKGASMCVFAGSLPRDVDTDIYAGLIRELRRLGVTSVVDTDGDPLRRAVRAEPDVISPNVLEAEELVGHEFTDDPDEWAIATREMCELGAREAIMTMGEGCFARMRPEDGGSDPALYRVRLASPTVEPRATIGSGDAFLAGFVAARYSGRNAADCLAYGVACGAESTQHLGAGLIDPERVARLLGETEVQRMHAPAEIS